MKHAQQPLGTPESGGRGARIGNLTLLKPYRPIFIGVALAALLFAYRRLFTPMGSCQPQNVCVRRPTQRGYKILFEIAGVLILVTVAAPYMWPFI